VPFSATRDLWLVLKARDEGTRAMRSFSRDVRQVGDTVRQAHLMAARSALQQQMAVDRLAGASRSHLLVQQRQLQTMDGQISKEKMARATMEEHRVSAQRLSSTFGGLAAAAAAMGTTMTVAGVLGLVGMHGLIESAIDYQKQSSLTRTQVDKFAVSLRDIEDIGLRVAAAIGVPFEQIQTALFDIFSSMEVNAKDAEKLLMIFAKAAVAGQTDIQSASRATIGILNAFHLPLSKVNHLMDLQFQLVQEGVGTYEEWTQRIGLVTPSAARAGQSVETMLAALAATTRMGISAARSGTAVARAFDAMSNPKTVKQLKLLGVNAVDAKGNFRPLIDVLGEFRTAIMKLPKADRIAKILEVFKGAGGTIEARRFLQNMLLTPGNLELFKTIFDEMSKETGSFEKAYAIMADTAATKSELLKNKWQTVKIAAGEALIPTFLKIIDFIGRMLDKFNKLSPATKEFIVKGLAIFAIFSLVVGVLLLVVGGILAFAAAIAVVGAPILIAIAAVGALGAGLLILGGYFVTAYKKSQDFRDRVSEVFKRLKAVWDEVVKPTFEGIKKAFDEHLKPVLESLQKVIREKVIPVLDALSKKIWEEWLPALKELGRDIQQYAMEIFRAFGMLIKQFLIPIIEKLIDWYHEHKETVDMVVAGLLWFIKWIMKIILLFIALTILISGSALIGALAALITIFGLIAAAVIWVVDRVRDVITWFRRLGDQSHLVKAKVITAFDALVAYIKNIPGRIVAVFGSAATMLWNAGKNIINGLVGGMKEAIAGGAIAKAAAAAAQQVADHLPHSPAKMGPLSGKGSPFRSGQNISRMLSNGMISKLGLINRANNAVAGMAGFGAGGAIGAGGKNIHQEITINTQEISPRRQAAELGWLFAGRM